MKKNMELSPEQKENAKHGEAFFPVRKYFTRLAPDYPVIPNHWHDEAEQNMTVEMIADGIHVPPIMLRMIYQIKGVEKTALVTDSLARLNPLATWRPSP